MFIYGNQAKIWKLYVHNWLSQLCYDKKKKNKTETNKEAEHTLNEWWQKGYWKHTMSTWFVIFQQKKIGNTNAEVTLRGWFSQRCNVNFWAAYICTFTFYDMHKKNNTNTYAPKPCNHVAFYVQLQSIINEFL